MITRKRFLTLSSLGIASLFFPSTIFLTDKNQNILDINVMLKNASDLRKAGNLNQAKLLYNQIIATYPQDVRAYDGKRKIFLHNNSNVTQVVLMYKNAFISNPTNVQFEQRLYNEFLRITLGNKKYLNLASFIGRLLQKVKLKYEGYLISSHPNKKNVQKQLDKINKLLDWNADASNPNLNTNLRTYKKQQYQLFKKRFDHLSTDAIGIKLNNLLQKPSNPDRKQHIRELYELHLKRLRKEKKYDLALNKAVEYYNTIEKQDPLFLKHIRDLAKYKEKYDILINIETQNHTLKNTFWSALSLFDAHLKKANAQNTQINSTVISILNSTGVKINSPQKKFEINTRKIKIAINTNQLNEAKTLLSDLCRETMGIKNPHILDRINVLAAKYFVKKGELSNKNKLLGLVISPNSYFSDSEELIKKIAYLNQNRSFVKPIHIQSFQQLLLKM